VTEIAVYIEGGGNTVGIQTELRQGFDAMFKREKLKASEKKVSLRFIFRGGRDDAYQAFINALRENPERINAPLVDSEIPIAPAPKDKVGEIDKVQDALLRVAHLRQKQGTGARGQGDGWELSDRLAERVHLMVQCMEAWIVADPEKLEEFFKQKFKKNSLPKRENLEEEPKADLYDKLRNATKDTQKGEYGKIKHASKLLGMIDPNEVAKHCPRFKIFREWLVESIG
jgi:hypothetical protein